MTLQANKSLLTMLTVSFYLCLPLTAWAESFTGRLNGHDCAHHGTSCPVDNLDPHINLESDFVLQTGDGEYYFLPNLRRDTKVRYVLQEIQVSGVNHERYNSILVDEFRIKHNGKWKIVWSPKLQRNTWLELSSRSNPRN